MMEELQDEDLMASANKSSSSSSASSSSASSTTSNVLSETDRLRLLEEEQEQLNSSLMALTTHFGQVQFRLRQIVNAPNEMKESLLKELEEFASRGCPNLANVPQTGQAAHEHIIEEQRRKQKELIDQLKGQLEDLESYAYQSGELEMPSSMMMQKQKVIIDELKKKIDLPLENFNNLTNDDLKKVVDNAIGQIVNPVKVKEHLVGQLKTQIDDLERFIDFLQGDASSPGPYASNLKCQCPLHPDANSNGNAFSYPANGGKSEIKNNETTIDILKKMLAVMQLFSITNFACGANPSGSGGSSAQANGSVSNSTISTAFEKNALKKTEKHYGDLRASLEVSIAKVIQIARKCEQEIDSDDEVLPEELEMDDINNNMNPPSNQLSKDKRKKRINSHELNEAVKKELAVSLRDLMQHGFIELNPNRSLVPAAFACFAIRSRDPVNDSALHAWDLFLKYYEAKQGKEFTNSPARKLSQSFGLQVIGSRPVTIKQSLLSAIETVMNLHKQSSTNTRSQLSKDAQFRSFVTIALNEKRLVLYLKQIFKTTGLVESVYEPWSYVRSTGFDDALKSLDQLKAFNFGVSPIDKHVNRFARLKELF